MKIHNNQVRLEDSIQTRLEEVALKEGFSSNAGFIRWAVVQKLNEIEKNQDLPTFEITEEIEKAVKEALEEYEKGETKELKLENFDELFE